MRIDFLSSPCYLVLYAILRRVYAEREVIYPALCNA